MKTKFYFLFIVMVAMCTIVTSCSTPTEKREKQLISEKKKIIAVSPTTEAKNRTYLYYSDVNGLYYEDVITSQTKKIIEFRKPYKQRSFFTRFDNGGKTLSFEDRVSNPSIAEYNMFNRNTEYTAFDDYGIIANVEGDQYVFLLDSQGMCYPLENIKLIDSNSSLCGKKCIHFTITGDALSALWSREMADFFFYWYDNRDSASEDLFNYELEVELQQNGQLITDAIPDKIYFKNLSKSYQLCEVTDGTMSNELSSILYEKAKTLYINSIKEKSIWFGNIVNEFTHNPVSAAKNYPKGNKFVLHTKIDKISQSNTHGYKYRLEYLDFLHDYLYVYTDDDTFAELEYPCELYLQGTYEGKVTEGGWLTLEDRYYLFSKAKLLIY